MTYSWLDLVALLIDEGGPAQAACGLLGLLASGVWSDDDPVGVFAFTRPGDTAAQDFARRLGAVWAGDSTQQPPEQLDAALIFAPVGSLIVDALRATVKGGTVVSGGIHMSDIPAFPYRLLWEERAIRSVANLTRQDGEEFLAIAPQVPVKTEVHTYPLEGANQALNDLRIGKLQGAAVLVVD